MTLPHKPKIFCGNGTSIPPGYDARGTRYGCLKKGFGAGRYMTTTQHSISYMPAFLLILTTVAVAVITYLFLSETSKPSSYKDDRKKKNYNVRPK